jgi:uncharacterized DUF497 family protein
MNIEFDPAKDAENLKKHGVSLALAEDFEWESAIVEVDNRFPYEEVRMNALVPLGNQLYHVTFAERGERMRVISLRTATNPEKRKYAQNH